MRNGWILVGLVALLFTSSAWAQDSQPEPTSPEPQATSPEPEAASPEPEPEAASSEPEAEAASPEPEPEPEPEVTEEEMKALQAAMAADAEEVQESQPTAEPEPAPSAAQNIIQSMNPDIALILDVAAAYFSDDDTLQTGAHDPQRTGFNLQQLEMSIGASVDPYFRFDANLVFAEFGVEVEEAYATSLAFPANLQLRAGQFLTKFGRSNATHPHSWKFADQNLVNGKFFGGEGSRGLGAEVSWLAPLPWYVLVLGSTTNPWGECCARSYYGGSDIDLNGPQDLVYTTALRQFFPLSDNWSLYWGLSAQFGPNPTGLGNRSEIYGTDIYLRWRPVNSTSRTAVSLTIEGMARRRQVPQDVLADYGGTAQLVWEISPRWETGARYEYVTGVQDDYLEDEWFDDRQRTSLQLTFYPSHFSRVRLQGNYDAPKWRDDPIWGTFLAFEVVVGAHGTHEY